MALALLVLATVIDLAVAALLVAVSGFVFGAGPESAHGGPLMLTAWIAMLIFCLAAPIAGFAARAYRRADAGAVVAWLPPLLALIALVIKPPY